MNRQIGGRSLPAVGLGCMGLSEFYGEFSDDQAVNILNKAYEIGYRHFDTADMYGRGKNEEVIGRFISEHPSERENMFISSKCGILRDPEEKYTVSLNGSPDYIRHACEDSLKRLQTEYIDLYYLHRIDPNVPLEESLGALTDLVNEGKIVNIGISEINIDQLRQATSAAPIAAVQNEYSLWSRDPEEAIIPYCKQQEIAFVCFSPLGRGFLSGVINKSFVENLDANVDFRAKLPRFSIENIEKNSALMDQLRTMSEVSKVSVADLSLAWVLSKSDNIHIIPGTKTEKYLKSNFASQSVELSNSTIDNLEEIFYVGAAAGGRYPQK